MTRATAILGVVVTVLAIKVMIAAYLVVLAIMVGFCVLVGAAMFDMLGWNYPVALAAGLVTIGVLAHNTCVFVADWAEERARRLPPEEVIRRGRAVLVNHDDFGKLWRIDRGPVHTLLVVEVVNMTAEPDGSHRRHILRVPPNVRTAREAVAWTFGFEDVRDYALTVES